MRNTESTGLIILLLAVVVLVAVVAGRFGERTRVPAPFLFLVGAAAFAGLVPGVGHRVPGGRPASRPGTLWPRSPSSW